MSISIPLIDYLGKSGFTDRISPSIKFGECAEAGTTLKISQVYVVHVFFKANSGTHLCISHISKSLCLLLFFVLKLVVALETRLNLWWKYSIIISMFFSNEFIISSVEAILSAWKELLLRVSELLKEVDTHRLMQLPWLFELQLLPQIELSLYVLLNELLNDFQVEVLRPLLPIRWGLCIFLQLLRFLVHELSRGLLVWRSKGDYVIGGRSRKDGLASLQLQKLLTLLLVVSGMIYLIVQLHYSLTII